MITLAFGQMVYFILVSLQFYGGDDGLMISARNTLPGINLESPLVFYYVCLALLTAWTLLCMRITSSRFGMVLQALRQSERRALNLGVAPTPYRLGAFVLSAVGTGLAGVLWANYAGLVTPDMAAWTKSGELMAIVILGGVGTLLGPIAGAAVFLGLEQVLTSLTEHWLLYMGPILVLVVLCGQRACSAASWRRAMLIKPTPKRCALPLRGASADRRSRIRAAPVETVAMATLLLMVRPARCCACPACARPSTRWWPPTAWTWTCAPARSTPSSARTAQASPR